MKTIFYNLSKTTKLFLSVPITTKINKRLILLMFFFFASINIFGQQSNITISSSSTTGGTWSGTTTRVFTPNSSTANIENTELASELLLNNVTINTAFVGGTGTGNVTFSNGITSASTGSTQKTFTINAGGSITVNSAINLTPSNSDGSNNTTRPGSNVSFTSGTSISVSAAITTTGNQQGSVRGGNAGYISLVAGTTIAVTGGALTANGGNSGNSDGGNIALTGPGGITLTRNLTATASGTGTAGAFIINDGSAIVTTGGGVNDGQTAGTISGGGLTKSGNGTFVMAGSNSYAGLTTISEGTLRLGDTGGATNTPLGTTSAGTTVKSGAVLDLAGITIGTAKSLTLNGTGISSGGALTNSSGTASTYSGLITIGSASSIVASSGNIILSNTGTITGSGFGLTLSGTATACILASSIGTGTGTLTKNGSGTWTLSGLSTYTGATAVNAGTLKAGVATTTSNGAFGNSSAVTMADVATAILNITGFNNTIGSITGGGTIGGNVTLGAATLTIGANNTSPAAYAGIISGTGTIIKNGTGILTFSGANTYTGLTTVSAGKLALGVSSSVSTSGPLGTTGSGTIVTSGAVLDLNGFLLTNSATEALSLNGSGIANGGALTNSSSTASNFIGLITIVTAASIITNAGDVNLTNTGAFTSDGLILTIGGTGKGTISGAFTANSQGITKIGAGTWKLSGANTYDGATLISAGTLQLGSTSALGSANGLVTVSSGAVLDLNGFSHSVIKNTTINGTGIASLGALTNSSSTAATYPGIIVLGGPSSIVGETGSIAISNTSQINGQSYTLTLGGAMGGSFSGALNTGSGGLTKIGTGTWTINAQNYYTGSTTISAGTLKLGIGITGNSADRGPLGTSSVGTVVAAGAVLDFNGNSIDTFSTPEALTLNGSGISGGGALTNTGAAATFNGAITLGSASVITANSSGSLTCSGTVKGAFGLTLGGAGTGTMSGIISAPTSLTKNGVGSWTLSGTNTYIGTTTVSAGILVLNNTAALGATSNSFVVSSGAKADIVSNVTVGALTLNNLGASIGTWGFTGSGATFINATSFTNSTTGKITVSTDSRIIPVLTPTVGSYTYSGTAQGPNTAKNTGTGTSYTFSYVGTGVTTYTASSIRPTNAGTYTVTVTVAADGNYNSASSPATPFFITAATLTVTATGPSKIYGTALTAGASSTNFSVTSTPASGQALTSVTLTPDATGLSATTAAGAAYVVTPSAATGTGGFLAGNYNIIYVAFNGTVTAATLTVTGATTANKEYDGNNAATVTGSTLLGIVGSDVVTLTQSGTFAQTGVGTSIAITSTSTLGGANATNYSLTQPNLTARSITAKELTVIGATTANKVYDGTTTAIVTGGTLVGVVGSDVVTLTQSGTFVQTGVGTNIAITSTSTISGTNAINYSLTQPSLTVRNITAKALTVTGATTANKVYDGTTTAIVIGGTLVGIVGSDVVTLTPSGTFAQTGVGTNIAITSTSTISGTNAINYSLTQPSLTARSITAKALTVIAATTANKVYDGTTTAIVIGGTLVGIVGSDAVTLTQSGTFAQTGVGTNIAITSTSTISGTNAINYSLTQPSLTARSITAKALTVTGATTANKVYDGTTTAIVIGGTLVGIVGSDAVTLTQSGTFAQTGVGTNIAITSTSTISGTNAINYSLTQPSLTVRNITAKALTVTGATTANKVYDGTTTAIVIGGTLVGIVGSDVVTLTQSGTFAQTGVGTNIAISSTSTLGGANATNYSLTQPSLTARSITAKALTVTGATTANKVYDGTTTAIVIGGTLVGVVGSDAVTLTQSGTFAQTGVGTNIAITSTSTLGGANAGNYSLTQPSLTARNIIVKNLTITGLIGSNKIYDGFPSASATGTAAVSGLVLSENVTLGGTPTYTFASANVGTAISISTTGYTISGTAAVNYTLTQPTLAANITLATPMVAPTVGSYTYSGTAQGPNAATNTGTGTSYTFSYVGTGGTTYTASSIRPTNAGTYTVTVTVAADANYNSASSSATAFTITKATPTASLAVSNSPTTYSGSAQSATVGISTSSVAGTVTTISTGGSATQTNAGTYAVTVSFVPTDSANYTTLILHSAGNFVINKATPTATLSVSNSPTTYSGFAQSATVSISVSSVPGTVTTISTGGSTTQTNAGTYAVTASFVPTDGANYNTLTLQSAGNFVIIPAVLTIIANNNSKCFGNAYVLETTAFTTIGLVSPQTIKSVTLISFGADSAAAVATYLIVPSAATGGTFLASNYTIRYTNGTLTVKPKNTVGVASSTSTLCLNSALTEITHATTGATGIGTATNLPDGITASFVSNIITINGTPTVSGTFNYTIALTGGCGSINAMGTISVSPTSAGGTVAGSATVCSGTNSATLTLSGHTGTITRWESSLDNFATAGTSIANTTNTLTASDLKSTTYYRAVVTSGVCASANSTVVTVTVNSCINKWKGSISKDWNTAGNWTQNLVPAVDANIIFDDSPANDCYLDQNRSVTNITNAQGVYGIVLNGNKLTLKGNLVFSGGATIDASASNSTMQFSGSAVQSISTGVFKNAAVYNLVVNNSNNVVLSGNLRLLNNLTATKGLLDAFTNLPTVTYAGNTLQTIEGNQFLEGKIFNLTVDNLIGVNMNTNFTIENTLLINANKIVSVASLYQLTALGTITNNGGVSGLILKSNTIGTASLIHNTDNVPATVQRYISGPTEGWHFLSAPVSNQAISGSWLPVGSYGTGNTATGTGFDLYVWDEPSFSFKYKLDTTPIGWNSVHSGPNFSAGRGYLYSVQETNPTKEFTGNLINGPVNYPITFTETSNPKLFDLKGFNLVGNPYPSSVDWQAASGWDRTKLEVSGGGSDMWVWNPTANNYGVFNSASGVGTNSISRYIAPMQGYFVKAANTGNLVFDNRVRVHTGAGNWFKNSTIKNPIIRITVESEDGNGADEALLQFGYSNSNQGTSKLFSHVSSAPSLYLNLDDKSYSVRYLTNTAENNSVAMEFKAGKEGFYKLVFNCDSEELDFIQLEDRLLKTSTSVKLVNSYLFKSSKEDSVSRFVLHFTAPEIPAKNVLNGLVYMDGSQIAVDLKGISGQTEIKVFDNAGKLILQKYLEGSGLTKLDLNLATQMLLVRLTNAKGASITKVLFNPLKQ
jgi:autotransporter-associated beta strand protein